VVAGPIERRSDLFPEIEIESFQLTFDNFESGSRWLYLGLFMKFVLADNIQDLGNWDRRWVKYSTSVLNKSDTESFINPSEVAATGNIIQIFMRK
jgi:D-alanyl-lipoteichoic acid acyltransferase DltB (MBOAT superfamily)